jgi:hypothetical protein
MSSEPGIRMWLMDIESWLKPANGWPEGVWTVPYNSLAGPASGGPDSWLDGSNCQRYAYGILNLFGVNCPPLRSSNLWEDAAATKTVQGPQPHDLVFFAADSNPFGAHIGVWMAPDEVLHLCKEMGRPTAWSMAEFAKRSRYRTLIGMKRITEFNASATENESPS